MNFDKRLPQLIWSRRVQLGLVCLLAVVTPLDLRGQIPPNSNPPCGLSGPTYKQVYYLQPRIERADKGQRCGGDWTLAGFFVSRSHPPEETNPGTRTCLMDHWPCGPHCGINYPNCDCNNYPEGCDIYCGITSADVNAPFALYHVLQGPIDRFDACSWPVDANFNGPAPQCLDMFGATPTGNRQIRVVAEPKGIQRGGTLRYRRQWAFYWSCADCLPQEGDIHGDGSTYRFRIESDPNFGADAGTSPSGPQGGGGPLAAFALPVGADGCCGDAPSLNLNLLSFDPDSGANAARGGLLKFVGYTNYSSGNSTSYLLSFKLPGKVMLSNYTVPVGWSADTSPNFSADFKTFDYGVEDSDGYRYEFHGTNQSAEQPNPLQEWAGDEILTRA